MVVTLLGIDDPRTVITSPDTDTFDGPLEAMPPTTPDDRTQLELVKPEPLTPLKRTALATGVRPSTVALNGFLNVQSFVPVRVTVNGDSAVSDPNSQLNHWATIGLPMVDGVLG